MRDGDAGRWRAHREGVRTMRRTVIDNALVEIDKIDVARTEFKEGDFVYAIWPEYRPEARYRYVGRVARGDFPLGDIKYDKYRHSFAFCRPDGTFGTAYFDAREYYRKAPK